MSGDLELSVRAFHAMSDVGARTVLDLVLMREEELFETRCFGETTFREVKQKLAERGLSLGMRPEQLHGLPGLHARIVAPGMDVAPAEAEPEAPCCSHCQVASQKLRARSDRNRALAMSLDELRLPVRAARSLEKRGVTTVGELVRLSADDLAAIRDFGRSALREVKARLAEHGLRLAPQTA
jgi:DNA-directed RNA polymerase alpha subunit